MKRADRPFDPTPDAVLLLAIGSAVGVLHKAKQRPANMPAVSANLEFQLVALLLNSSSSNVIPQKSDITNTVNSDDCH